MQRHEGEHKGLEIKWRGSVVRTGRYRRDRHSYGSGVAKNCERLPFSAKVQKVSRACDYSNPKTPIGNTPATDMPR